MKAILNAATTVFVFYLLHWLKFTDASDKKVYCVLLCFVRLHSQQTESRNTQLRCFLSLHYILAGNRTTIHNPKKSPLQKQLIELQSVDNSYQMQSTAQETSHFVSRGVKFLKLCAEFGYFKFQLQ